MPIAKTQATVCGQENTGLIQLDRYGLRTKLIIPGQVEIAATHRASSGTTRTLTLAQAHGMEIGDLFLYGGFSNSNYNEASSDSLGVVTAVPDVNVVRFTKTSTLTEAEVAATQGSIVVLPWKYLRMAVRLALPRESTWSAVEHWVGWGVSQGPHPFQSSNCGGWRGRGLKAGTPTHAGTPPYLSLATTHHTSKIGTTLSGYIYDGTQVVSASREGPSILTIELSRVDTNRYFHHYTHRAHGTQNTRDLFRAVLQDTLPAANADRTWAGRLFANNGAGYQDTSPYVPGHYGDARGKDLYIEVFGRDPNQAVEVYDVGYSFWR